MTRGLTTSSAQRILALGAQVGIFTQVYQRHGSWGYELSSPAGRRFCGRNFASWPHAERRAAMFALVELRRSWKKVSNG